MGSLYVNEKGAPCWPGENIESMLQAEGAKNRMKKQVQAGVISDGLFPLIYKGPKTAEGLWAERDQFALRVVARNQQNRIMRTRPIFREWGLTFDVELIEEEISKDTIKQFVAAAGVHIGLSDWRPKYGRFIVEKVEEI